jgi:hypothetical protein
MMFWLAAAAAAVWFVVSRLCVLLSFSRSTPQHPPHTGYPGGVNRKLHNTLGGTSYVAAPGARGTLRASTRRLGYIEIVCGFNVPPPPSTPSPVTVPLVTDRTYDRTPTTDTLYTFTPPSTKSNSVQPQTTSGEPLSVPMTTTSEPTALPTSLSEPTTSTATLATSTMPPTTVTTKEQTSANVIAIASGERAHLPLVAWIGLLVASMIVCLLLGCVGMFLLMRNSQQQQQQPQQQPSIYGNHNHSM